MTENPIIYLDKKKEKAGMLNNQKKNIDFDDNAGYILLRVISFIIIERMVYITSKLKKMNKYN